MAKKRRRKGRGGKLFLLLILLALAIVGYNRVFRIHAVLVEGVEEDARDHVVALSGVNLGESIFTLSEARVKMGLSADPYLEYISMSRRYPDRIVLRVRRRQAAGAVSYSGVYLLIDDEGRILENTQSLPAGMPAVTSVKVSSANIGTKLTSNQSDQVAMLLAVIQALNAQDALSAVRQIDVGDRNSLYLVTEGDVKVILGDETQLDRKVAWMLASLTEMAGSGYSGGILDVSSGKNAVYAPAEG